MADTNSTPSETPRKAADRSNGTVAPARKRSKSASTRRTGARTTASRARTTNNSVHAPLHEMKSDAAALRTDASRLVHGIEGVAVEKLNEITQRSRDEITKTHDKIKEFVGERPITSIAIALGVGAILARILR